MNLQNYSEAQLAAAEEMAAHGFTLDEAIEVVLADVDLISIRDAPSKPYSAFYKAFRTGHLKSQLELRQRIFKDAKNGSSPAQMLAKKIMDDAAYKLEQS